MQIQCVLRGITHIFVLWVCYFVRSCLFFLPLLDKETKEKPHISIPAVSLEVSLFDMGGVLPLLGLSLFTLFAQAGIHFHYDQLGSLCIHLCGTRPSGNTGAQFGCSLLVLWG